MLYNALSFGAPLHKIAEAEATLHNPTELVVVIAKLSTKVKFRPLDKL